MLVKLQDFWLVLSDWTETHLTVVLSDYSEVMEATSKLIFCNFQVPLTDLSSPLDHEETIRLSKLAFSPQNSDQVSFNIENKGNQVQVSQSKHSI